mmetsp:Transcript_23248/g.20127  ORF Transcript_23248/g.20127 Transcript_23248/m.20127 type:complete len:100 (-) Transcript_23248:388-687(-)
MNLSYKLVNKFSTSTNTFTTALPSITIGNIFEKSKSPFAKSFKLSSAPHLDFEIVPMNPTLSDQVALKTAQIFIQSDPITMACDYTLPELLLILKAISK